MIQDVHEVSRRPATSEEGLGEVSVVGDCNVDLDAKRVGVDDDPEAVDPATITAATKDTGDPVK